MNIRIKSRRFQIEWYYPGLFFALFFLKQVYLRLFLNLSLMFGFNTDITTYLYYFFMWILLIGSFFQFEWKVSRRYLTFGLLMIFIIIVNFLVFPNNGEYIADRVLQNLMTFSSISLTGSFLFFFIGGIVTNYKKTRIYLYMVSRIGLLAVLITDYASLFVIREKKYDDMAYAYGVCLLVCDILFELLEKRRKTDIVFFLIGFASLIVSGTRGPLICVAITFVLWTFLYQKKVTTKICAVITALIAGAFTLTDAFNTLLAMIDKALKNVGIDNLRILDYIYANTITDSSGRQEIYGVVWEKIIEKPVFGYGIGGDRSLINHAYTHNLILEILCHFGFLVGGIALVSLVYWVATSIFSKNQDFAMLSIILVASVVIKLMFSSSYIYSQELFFFLGICLNFCNLEI